MKFVRKSKRSCVFEQEIPPPLDDIHFDPASHTYVNSHSSSHSSNCVGTPAVGHRLSSPRAYKSQFGLDPEKQPARYMLEVFFQSQATELVLAIFILFSLVLLIAETDADKVDGKAPNWLVWSNRAVLIFFTVEALARIFTFRCYIFQDLWTVFDVLVVFGDLLLTIVDLVLQGMPSILMVRTVRLLRVFRSSKLTKHIPQLNIMVLSLAGAATPLFWGGVMLMLLLVSSGILAVQLINPVIEDMVKHGAFKECDRCKRSFETVWQSSLTIIQQVIAGDSWGTVCLPVIEHSPWTLIFFAFVFIIFAMAIMNIILSHIVDAVMQARLANDKMMAGIKRDERDQAKNVILSFCKALDADESGLISYREFMRGYDKESAFREALNAMDIRSEDLEAVWGVLDEERSGAVSYAQFCDQLYKLKYSDVHTIMMIMKSQVSELRKLLTSQIEALSNETLGANHETTRLMTTNSEQLHQITGHINVLQATQRFAVDLNIASIRSQERGGLNSLVVQPQMRQQTSDDEHHAAINRLLETLNNLDRKTETSTVALFDLIAKSRMQDAEIPDSHEVSSKSKEGSSSRNEDAAHVQTNDIYQPFAMGCKGSPPNSCSTTMASGSSAKQFPQQEVISAI